MAGNPQAAATFCSNSNLVFNKMSTEQTEGKTSAYEQDFGRADASGSGAAGTGSDVICTACEEPNGAANVHCEHCGARLGIARVGPDTSESRQLLLRAATTLFVVAAVIAVVSLVVLNPRSGGDPVVPEITSSTTQTTAPTLLIPLFPSIVEASSELDDFHASHLIDGDTSSYWNDASLEGEGAELMFHFDEVATFAALEFANVVGEESRRRNFRIRGFEIHVGDTADPISGELKDNSDWQRIDLGLSEADTVVIHVLSTFPAEPFGDGVPFRELALAEVRFFQADVP